MTGPEKHSIPPGARPSNCRSCGASIFWVHVTTASGDDGRLPIDAETGLSHFTSCPHATAHRKPRPPKKGDDDGQLSLF